MKILIVAQARSGSTGLLRAIGKSLNSEIIYEPFTHDVKNIDKKIDKIKKSKNIVVKVVDNDFYNNQYFKNEQNLFIFFDKIIGLTRDSDHEVALSFLIAEKYDSWRKSSKDFDININEIVQSQNYKKKVKNSIKIKQKIKSFDIFQVTYEGIYINKNEIDSLEKYLGLDIKYHIEPEGPLDLNLWKPV